MEDTIAAISTSPGVGAISVVRVSGKDSFEIVSKVFKGKKNIKNIKRKDIVYGWIIDENQQPIDEVLLFVMRGPHTYTGEDTIEISTHGGYIPAKKVLQSVLKAGARLAERGEFTKRAFFNGKIDLLKAESINDIVRAKTEKSFMIAERNLKGNLSKKIKKIRNKILDVISSVELSLDFPEEDVPIISYEKIIEDLEEIEKELSSLRESYKTSKALMDGINVIIIGRPNVGKSSIFNAILNEEKSIVTTIPGTTRDIIEGWIDLNGFPIRLLDTAGIRETKDEVETIGVKRTIKKIEESEVVIIVLDGSQELTRYDFELIEKYKDAIIVINKIDIGIDNNLKNIFKDFKDCVYLSAKEFIGIDELLNTLKKKIETKFPIHFGEDFITKERDLYLINKTIYSINNAKKKLKEKKGLEIVVYELNEGVSYIKEMIGEITSEEVLNKIFNEFCIGK